MRYTRHDPANGIPPDPRFPGPGAMATLIGVVKGQAVTVEEYQGEPVMAIDDPTRPGCSTLVTPEAMDDLESRGWVVIGPDGPRHTPAGYYWAARWVRLHHKLFGVSKDTRPEQMVVRGVAE
jgi:hypothetical protein